ncbi:MAG: hypothetical protein ABSE73_24605 [Planctomycetota bacterium]
MKTSHTSYTREDVARIAAGTGASTIWFGGGRLGVSVADHGGIEELVYFGTQPLHRREFFRSSFRSAYPRVFRTSLSVDGRTYLLELNQTEVFPAGYRSRLDITDEGVSIEHWLVVTNDALLQTVKVVANRHRRALRMQTALHNYNRVSPEGRTWTDWRADKAGAWTAGISDAVEGKESRTWCGVVADRPLSLRVFHSQKHFFETDAFTGGAVTTAVLFGHGRQEFRKRVKSLRRGASNEAQSALKLWGARLASVSSVRGLPPAVASFHRQQPLILDSLMVRDAPGAMRASVGHYWVWGWDTIVYGDSYLFGGRADFVKDALGLYERTADPREGIAHAFGPDFSISICQALAAQGLYGVWLYNYAAHTGDMKTVRLHYAFARTLFARTLRRERQEGLCAGTALFPDFPKFAGHNGHDISVFNNSIFYQAARCMEYLAGLMGDADTGWMARRAWLELEQTFRQRFWDAKQGFWADSLDSRDLSRRKSYPSHAILWITPFARELIAGRAGQCAEFMARHHAFQGGIRMYPAWDGAFNGDGNQLGQYYPVGTDVSFLNLMAASGRQQWLAKWIEWVAQFWEQHTVPEGLTAEADNDGPHRPDCPGGKQPFAAKAWQIGLLNGIVGVHFDEGGITVGPGLDKPLLLSGLPFHGKRWTISTRGRGLFIGRLAVNGRAAKGSCKVPADLCRGKDIRLDIERTARPSGAPQLVSANGAEVTGVEQTARKLRCRLTAPGAVRVRLQAGGMCTATWNGVSVAVAQQGSSYGQAVLLLPPANGRLAGELIVTGQGVDRVRAGVAGVGRRRVQRPRGYSGIQGTPQNGT